MRPSASRRPTGRWSDRPPTRPQAPEPAHRGGCGRDRGLRGGGLGRDERLGRSIAREVCCSRRGVQDGGDGTGGDRTTTDLLQQRRTWSTEWCSDGARSRLESHVATAGGRDRGAVRGPSEPGGPHVAHQDRRNTGHSESRRRVAVRRNQGGDGGQRRLSCPRHPSRPALCVMSSGPRPSIRRRVRSAGWSCMRI